MDFSYSVELPVEELTGSYIILTFPRYIVGTPTIEVMLLDSIAFKACLASNVGDGITSCPP